MFPLSEQQIWFSKEKNVAKITNDDQYLHCRSNMYLQYIHVFTMQSEIDVNN